MVASKRFVCCVFSERESPNASKPVIAEAKFPTSISKRLSAFLCRQGLPEYPPIRRTAPIRGQTSHSSNSSVFTSRNPSQLPLGKIGSNARFSSGIVPELPETQPEYHQNTPSVPWDQYPFGPETIWGSNVFWPQDR